VLGLFEGSAWAEEVGVKENSVTGGFKEADEGEKGVEEVGICWKS
jgi:hypothetical protein